MFCCIVENKTISLLLLPFYHSPASGLLFQSSPQWRFYGGTGAMPQ